jgi:hypothetical protein
MKLTRVLPFLAAGLVHGQQVYVPPANNQPAQPAVPVDSAPRQNQQPAASPFGQEIPMLDPSAETVTIGGVTIPLGDNRVLKARFEKYLNQPPESDEDAAEYRETIAEILATVSPFREGGPNLYGAFSLLPSAATYPGDANICSTLAEAVYMAMLAKQDIAGLTRLNQSMQKEKEEIIKRADWDARHDKDRTLNNTRAISGGDGGQQQPQGQGSGRRRGGPAQTNQDTANQPATSPGSGTNSLRYQDTLRRITELEALKKQNIVRTEAQTIRTKTQYQVNMIQWFVQRRYEHVVMAARFYNQIWKDGDTTLRIDKNSDVSKLFSESIGVSPTVSSLDSLSNEIIREVDKYIEAFDLLLSRDELHSASQRLMEAYALGEYLGPVATLPLEKKRRVADYVRDLHELYGTLQARDYTTARVLTARLKEAAKDFPSSKVDSAIAAYTLASDLSIDEAKAHLMARDSDKASEKIRAATELWPTNPKLEEFRTLIGQSGGLVTARNDFDRLLSERNYREIAHRQYEFAPAIQGDPVREDAFKQIITNLTIIETAISKASEFSKVGQSEAAYEQLAKIREQFTDDPRLGREIELLAPQVAPFTNALDNARRHEQSVANKQPGSALAWYLKARSIYPQSEFAEAGIKRMLDEILDDDASAPRASVRYEDSPQ